MKDTDVAIVGWHVRFPGANTIDEFWQNLRNGVESITVFTPDELIAAGYDAATVRSKHFVPATPMIEGIENFDASFFGFSPRDAEIIDPQYRIFIEEAWSALEDAGYDAEQFEGAVGVFAGTNISRYLLDSLKPLMDQDPSKGAALVAALCFNDKDALATLVSYKLNLTGPSVNVQSFCSTSLVAVHMGCQSLRLRESDMVVAGGSNLHGRNAAGYSYRDGDILSPDGHCRAFDALGRGTLFGSGAGAVILKRLPDAIADGDTIHAVIVGSAVNNDGAHKAGYTAPSLEGQAEAVTRALDAAGVDPATIGFVEAHGTGTEVGDPIEVGALAQAYRRKTDKKTYCALGSVKTNFGHLDRAAGVSSLVKATLAVKHGQVPPTVHFNTPNPKIDFESSPFFVNKGLIDWPLNGGPRRAGVSGLGFGGTNAHFILEQAPEGPAASPGRAFQILPISARTETALSSMSANLARHLQRHPEQALADVAWTLQKGRRQFPHRQAVVCADASDAISTLESGAAISGGEMVSGRRDLVFLFPGQGAQYVGMARGLYDTEPVFRECVDRCAESLRPHLGLDLRDILYPPAEADLAAAAERLKQTALTQPSLFVVEYALATLLERWGLRPSGMIGHSVGEYVAACLAGVFTLDDALMVVASRGRLMQSCPAGAMLAVMAQETVVRGHLSDDVSLAAVNAPGLSVLSGTFAAIERVEADLAREGIQSRRLETSHAFHSSMMDGILAEFHRTVASVRLAAPRLPFVSNVTAKWIDARDATDPGYWVRHLREAVRFAEGLAALGNDRPSALIEVGPGRTLLGFAKRIQGPASRPMVPTLRHSREASGDLPVLLQSVATLWVAGVEIDWNGLHEGERRLRVPLPTYPFERTPFWLEPDRRIAPVTTAVAKAGDVADWFYVPAWRRTNVEAGPAKGDGRPWLIFGDGLFADVIERRLIDAGEIVRRVAFGRGFAPGRAEGFSSLFDEMRDGNRLPGYVVHAGNLLYGAPLFNALEAQDRAFFSALFLVQELGRSILPLPVRVSIVTDRLFGVAGERGMAPERATLLGPCRVTRREHTDIRTTAIDLPEITAATEVRLADLVIAETAGAGADEVVAYRGDDRLVQTYEKTPIERPVPTTLPLKKGGCYLITGGTGGIGLTLAEHLARQYQAKLVLTSRRGSPAGGSGAAGRIRDIERLGGEVSVAKANIADFAAMTAVVEEAERRFGRIDGVFHTAGIAGGGAILRKKKDVAARVLEPKVTGTLVLDALFKNRAPDFVALFSSAASVAGPFGQVDYCAANAFLDAFAASRQTSATTRWISIDWDDWAEVGMAVETSARLGADGDAAPRVVDPLAHPLFSRKESEQGTTAYIARLATDSGWLLGEHVLFGKPTLPGSAFLEYARAAFECETGQEGCEMTDLFLLKPLSVEPGEARELSVTLTPGATGYSLTIESGEGPNRLEHVRGSIASWNPPEKRHDVAALREACQEQAIDEQVLSRYRAAKEGGYLALGRRWANTRRVFYGPDTILGEHELDADCEADVATYKLHPAFTDFTALFPLYLSEAPAQYVPFSYDAVRVRAALPKRILSLTRVKDSIENGPRTIRFDCQFLDETGRELMEIDNLFLHLMEGHIRSETAEPSSPNYALAIQTPGVLETMALSAAPRRAPGDGEVEIQVAAAGLNFRDVLRALGMLAAEHDAGAGVVGFGAECAGKVVRVGAGVTGVAVGDDVLAFATRSFSSFVTTSAKAVAPIPAALGFVEAASIPMVFLTAYHALHGLARVRRGERVLIHAAAGGVGLAAVQIARMMGAEVIGTVGSPAKREYLETLGVRHVSTSRSLDFADEVRRFTNGEGVDVVLNALAGDFIAAGLQLLRVGGRFIEIGARDIYQNSSLGLRPFASNLTFSAFDLGQLAAQDPDYLREMLVEILEHFERGRLQVLPIETYPIAEASTAFRHMAAARHIGKVVVSVMDMVRSTSTRAHRSTAPSAAARGRDLSHGILPAEGIDALERALGSAWPQVVVTTRPLHAFLSDSPAASPSARVAPAGQARKFHPRPALPTPYKAPETEEERVFEQLWRELLGLEKIGVNDNFFELGGDSLLGVQLISVIKANHVQYAGNIRPADLYEGPTIRELARKLAGLAETIDEEKGRHERAEARREQRERRRTRVERA